MKLTTPLFAAAALTAATSFAAGKPDFAKEIGPVLAKNCIECHGPEKQKGKLRLDIAGLDKNVLNLVGAKLGMDFGSTSIALANEITLAKAGKSIAATGQFAANNFGVTQAGTTTPALDLKLAYQVAVDLPAQAATVSTFNFTGTRQQRLAQAVTHAMRVMPDLGA